jgi:hypothetical protein
VGWQHHSVLVFRSSDFRCNISTSVGSLCFDEEEKYWYPSHPGPLVHVCKNPSWRRWEFAGICKELLFWWALFSKRPVNPNSICKRIPHHWSGFIFEAYLCFHFTESCSKLWGLVSSKSPRTCEGLYISYFTWNTVVLFVFIDL